MRQHLRKELEKYMVEPAAVISRNTIGAVEFTEPDSVIIPTRAVTEPSLLLRYKNLKTEDVPKCLDDHDSGAVDLMPQ